MPSYHLILCRPLLLPSIFPSIRVFSNESGLCIKWPKYWSFTINISPSNEHSGLISFRMDWLDLLAVQVTLKSLLQHHSSKASILQHSAFFGCPTLTSIHDHWKNHSLDKMDLCWQSNVQVRLYHTSIGVHHSAPKHQGPRGATHASLSTVVSTGSGLLEAFSWLRGACWTPPWGPGFLLGW